MPSPHKFSPAHVHNCPDCTFLCTMHTPFRRIDWYRHDDTVLARFGDRGPDYWSIPIGTLDNGHGDDSRGTDDEWSVWGMKVLARYVLDRFKETP